MMDGKTNKRQNLQATDTVAESTKRLRFPLRGRNENAQSPGPNF